MHLNFRIDWGYQYLYSRRHYHPVFEWDGHLECENGVIEQVWQLEYPVIWFGPGHCAKEIPLAEPQWQSRTRRGMSGIRVTAEVADETVFRLVTRSGVFEFSAQEIAETGRLVFPVGPKYLNCSVIVTKQGFLWFRPEPRAGQSVWEANDLALPHHDWARMETAWLAPGAQVTLPLEIQPDRRDYQETLLHLAAMAAPPSGYTPGDEKVFHAEYPIRVYADGRCLGEVRHFFREHDMFMQLLEDVWMRFQLAPGHHEIAIENGHDAGWLLLSRVVFQAVGYDHLQLSLPDWALVGEPLIGRVFAVRPDEVEVGWPRGSVKLALKPGWNTFDFSLPEPGTDIEVTAGTCKGSIHAVYALAEEKIPVMVGYDMTVVPHDRNGFMDWLLDYTERTRLGNLVVFRSFHFRPGTLMLEPVPGAWMREWGEFCRKHHIHVEAATDFDDGELVKGAGALLHSVGRHEYPGAVYAQDPKAPFASQDMREAMEKYLDYLKIEIERAHRTGARAAFGDASGAHRYCYMAGVDFLRTETMVPHTMHLCSQARPAAEALGSGEWGVHIAIHHPMQPYFENHLGIYYLSLMQPWMMGANMIYEEDSLFVLFKEERQCWDDALTKGKRDMTRWFFQFAKTHPRSGRCVRRIAFLEGRYAAPFNGFICDSEQTPDYAVWGLFGNAAPEWGHRQPEKCRQILDVLMPGANTQPLRQRYDRRRFFFSGTPFGDFDEVPVEAKPEYLAQYSLLLNLGWNTMIGADYEKMYEFVRNGGILLTGIPQFSTHVKRDFLRDFEDLALWNAGDLSEMAGIRVKGRGALYSGQWNCAYRELLNEPELSAMPSASAEEDDAGFAAEIELAGAEVVIYDASTGAPLLVRHSVGAGWVYTLTFWAYPGHEKFQRLSAAVVSGLASEARGEYFVADDSREVFWTVWQDTGDGADAQLLLLNTDWSGKDNAKRVLIHAGSWGFETSVREREALWVRIFGKRAVVSDASLFLQRDERGQLMAYGSGRAAYTVYAEDGTAEDCVLDFGAQTEVEFPLAH